MIRHDRYEPVQRALQGLGRGVLLLALLRQEERIADYILDLRGAGAEVLETRAPSRPV
jgi:hypothetical protein